MPEPRIALFYCSVHHGNTFKLLQAMASFYPIELIDATKPWTLNLNSFHLLGFASGVFYGRMHKKLHEMVINMTFAPHHQAFLICTQGAPFKKYGKDMQDALALKGISLLGRFNCLGWDSWGPLKLFGGIHKKRPNESDMQRAVAFLSQVMQNWHSNRHTHVTS